MRTAFSGVHPDDDGDTTVQKKLAARQTMPRIISTGAMTFFTGFFRRGAVEAVSPL
jgi:hypothetical protein